MKLCPTVAPWPTGIKEKWKPLPSAPPPQQRTEWAGPGEGTQQVCACVCMSVCGGVCVSICVGVWEEWDQKWVWGGDATQRGSQFQTHFLLHEKWVRPNRVRTESVERTSWTFKNQTWLRKNQMELVATAQAPTLGRQSGLLPLSISLTLSFSLQNSPLRPCASADVRLSRHSTRLIQSLLECTSLG